MFFNNCSIYDWLNIFDDDMNFFDSDEDKSYYHSIKKVYENGNLKTYDEKEVKNGEVLKDVHKSEGRLTNKCDKSPESQKCVEEKLDAKEPLCSNNNDAAEWKKSYLELTKRMDDIEAKYKESCKKNARLSEKLSNAQKLFNRLQSAVSDSENV